MLTIYADFFWPKDVREALRSLYTKTTTLSWRTIGPHLDYALGPNRGEINVEPRAKSSFSFGQIHDGYLNNGQQVEIRVAYPDVELTLDQDLSLIDSDILFSFLKVSPGQGQDILEEFSRLMQREADFTYEYDYMEYFSEELRQVGGLKVPKLLPEYSNSITLTTAFEPGVSILDPIVSTLDQPRRNRLGQLLTELFYKEVFELGIVQTTFHPGSFKIQLDNKGGDDKIILSQVAGCRIISPGFRKGLSPLIQSVVRHDHHGVISALETMDFINQRDPKAYRDFIAQSAATLWQILLSPGSNEEEVTILKAKFHSWNQTLNQKESLLPNRPLPKDFFFVSIRTISLFSSLIQLGAKVDLQDLILGEHRNTAQS